MVRNIPRAAHLSQALALALTACGPSPADPDPLSFVAVTFNTGTSEGLAHDAEPDDGYTSVHALRSDLWYGDGLAWIPAVEATAAFFAEVDPDVVAFQEIFHSGDCAGIPWRDRADFICEDWSADDPTVAQLVVGAGFQVACHTGNNDKCAAVNRRFGTFRGCDLDFCLEGLEGYRVDGCGRGARVGRGTIDLIDGSTLTLVSFHGSSGFYADDQQCRVQQVEQVFVDLGDGEPAANGERNLVMGDLNTDPGWMGDFDPSAARWNDFVGDGQSFSFVTDIGADATPTYAGLASIDHVMSDVLTGSCWTAGVTDGQPAVIDAVYFDHKPAVCAIEEATP